MSNKVLFGVLGATAAVATVATPATLLTGKELKEKTIEIKEEKKSTAFQEPAWDGMKMPQLNSSKDIKEKHKQFDCLKDREIYLKTTTGVGDFSFDNILHQSTLSSCLIAEYYKKTYTSEDKWWGGFRLMWSLLGDSLGLIIVINIKANDEKMTSDSSIYIVNGQSSNWTLAYQQENAEETITNKSELESKFPKPSSEIYSQGENNYWGFNPDPEKICKKDDCKDGGTENKQSLKWNWQKSDSSEKTINNWCANFDNLFGHILKDQKWSSISTKLKELKGIWTQET